MNGDELRRLALPVGNGYLGRPGYLASDVDELLLRVADEIDAGRPVGDLIANAALSMPEPVAPKPFRSRQLPRTYQVTAVHWLLGQLRRCDDDGERARLEADPWHDAAAWNFSWRHPEAGPSRAAAVPSDVPAVTGPADRNMDPWLACDGLPGTRLRRVRTGVLGSELRAEGGRVSASIRGPVPWNSWGQAWGVRVGGRAFTSQRVSRSAWPAITATFGAGFPAAGDLPAADRDTRLRVLADPSGVPVLCTGWQVFGYVEGAYIRLPRGRWFQFPWRGRNRGSAIMTALDQDGNKVAVYRMIKADVEITVHPDQRITDELLLVLAVSADWLRTYIMRLNQSG